MGTINGTIDGVTLLSGSPSGSTALDSTTVCSRRVYLVTAHFPAYTGSTDTATITGILTAINSATRNGKTLVLRQVCSAFPGLDANSQGVHFSGASNAAATLSNTTTTGDAAGNLMDASGTEITSSSGTTIGVGVIAVVDEE
jgi:hypothetical protein